MSVAIHEVRVARFRGFREPVTVRLNGRGLVLLGDNGSGKTSLVQAIQYGLTGDVPALSKRTQRVSLKRHLGHVQADGEPEVVVVLRAGGKEQEVGPLTDVDALPEPFRSYVATIRSQQFVLRRSHVLELVEAQDRDRYKALAPFLGVDGFTPVEAVCRRAAEKARRAHEAASARRDRAWRDLTQGMEASTEPEVLAWLQARAASLEVALPDSLGEAVDALASLEEDTALQHRDVVRGFLLSLRPLLDGGLDVTALATTLRQARSFDAMEAVRYEEVLDRGIRWLLEEESPHCPLCEQGIHREQVVQRARERLDAAAAAVDARRSLDQALTMRRGRLQHLTQVLKELEPRFLNGEGPLARLVDAATTWASRAKDALASDRTTLDIERLTDLDARASTLRQAVDDLLQALPSDPRGQRVSELTVVRERARAWLELGPALARARATAHRAERLHELAEQARRDAAQEVLASTADDVTSIYGAFHDHDEEELSVRVEIRDAVKGSAKLLIDFLERAGEDPRGLLSEGHLDTLGLALFFALARRARLPVLVLDDVLGTIDTAHRERVVRWLMTHVARDHQLLVTTHSRQWWEWLRHLQRVEGVQSRFRHLEVLASEGGVASLTDIPTRLEEVALAVAEGAKPEQIGRLAGSVLEAELREVRVAWRLAIEARPGERYTIGDIWPTLEKKLRKTRSSFKARADEHRARIEGLAPIRNWSTHPNDWSDLTRADSEAFAAAVKGLVDAMMCPDCQRRLVLHSSGAVLCPRHCPGGVFA